MLESERFGDKRIHPGRIAAISAVIKRAYKLGGKTLHDEYHHILMPLYSRVGSRMMQRCVHAVKFRTCCEIGRHHRRTFTNGAYERERCVEHNIGLSRTCGKLMCVAHGDGARRGEECGSPHTPYGYDSHGRYRYDIDSPFLPRLRSETQRCLTIEPPQTPDDDSGQQHEIPVIDNLDAEDASYIVLVAKLVECTGSDAVMSERIIHAVAEIEHHGYGVGYEISHPRDHTVCPVAAGSRKRKHREHDIQNIGITDGGCVKPYAAAKNLNGRLPCQRKRILVPVFKQKRKSAHTVSHISHNQVGRNRHCGAQTVVHRYLMNHD